jgi:hypothetical protein
MWIHVRDHPHFRPMKQRLKHQTSSRVAAEGRRSLGGGKQQLQVVLHACTLGLHVSSVSRPSSVVSLPRPPPAHCALLAAGQVGRTGRSKLPIRPHRQSPFPLPPSSEPTPPQCSTPRSRNESDSPQSAHRPSPDSRQRPKRNYQLTRPSLLLLISPHGPSHPPCPCSLLISLSSSYVFSVTLSRTHSYSFTAPHHTTRLPDDSSKRPYPLRANRPSDAFVRLSSAAQLTCFSPPPRSRQRSPHIPWPASPPYSISPGLFSPLLSLSDDRRLTLTRLPTRHLSFILALSQAV